MRLEVESQHDHFLPHPISLVFLPLALIFLKSSLVTPSKLRSDITRVEDVGNQHAGQISTLVT